MKNYVIRFVLICRNFFSLYEENGYGSVTKGSHRDNCQNVYRKTLQKSVDFRTYVYESRILRDRWIDRFLMKIRNNR